MQAERIRAEVVAANMANAESTRTDTGGPYRRHHVVFAANGDFEETMSKAQMRLSALGASEQPESVGGVHIEQVIEDASPPMKRYDPGHPDADAEGYVSYPDINPLTEMVDLMGATRAYGLNSSAVQAEKGMITSALEIARS